MGTRMAFEAARRSCGDEEAFLRASAALGEARRTGKLRSAALLEAVVEDLAFELGARAFPPAGTRAKHALSGQGAGARSTR
ncbi:MAG: hypothetical protein CYG60_17085 [Actinobacteria bacterium]|nr:hypothetical protein [Actinomycetota bacterium]PLS84601.1 MAG: hypothetical protein CYG60_17085 [Actinomycetota bacterium]